MTETDLQQFYHELKTNGWIKRRNLYGPGLSDRSVRGCHLICRVVLDKAVEEQIICVNPAQFCKLPGESRRETQVLTREEMQQLLIQAKADSCYELLLLELSIGLRRGELLALQWEDLDLQTGALQISRQVSRVRGKLTISPPKTDATVRTILLAPRRAGTTAPLPAGGILPMDVSVPERSGQPTGPVRGTETADAGTRTGQIPKN